MNLSQYRRTFACELVSFLEMNFAKHLGSQPEWWRSHVLNNLSRGQMGQVRALEIERLGQFDLHALLRIFDRNWGELSYWCRLANNVRTLMKGVADQRNDASHQAAEVAEVDAADLYRDIDTLARCSSALNLSKTFQDEIADARTGALARLASSQFPQLSPAQPNLASASASVPIQPPDEETETPPNEPAVRTHPVGQQQSDTPESTELAARVFGNFRLHGPESSFASEITSFSGRPVPATEIPWRVTGPDGIELKVHICLIDDPEEEDEIGQVFCDSRLASPQHWDEVVRRLRIGIRRLDDDRFYMDLRAAQHNGHDRATRRVIPIESLPVTTGFQFATELQRLGTCELGTRAELTGATGRTRAWPCMTFAADDILSPVAAWVAVTVSPLMPL